MSDSSDYKKSRMKLDEMLPNVYRSDVNKSLFENAFNRFFTKNETVNVAGYIGRSDAKYVKSRQIPESTLHRQAFQLQPVLHTKLGSTDHLLSWKDILNKLEQQGVDIERLPIWGSMQQFNWAPPIDMDKIINYRNYYWVDDNNTNSQPQYLTIRSRCATARANLNFWNKIINDNGTSFTITDLLKTDDLMSEFNQIVISGNYESLFGKGFPLYISGSLNTSINEQTFLVSNSFHFDGYTYITTETTFANNLVSGIIDLTLRQNVLQSEYDCQCFGSSGWDSSGWDDNPENPIWGGSLDTLLASISQPIAPTFPTSQELWFDVINDNLYQSNGSNWVLVYNNFSDILAQTNGQTLWDMTPNCGVKSAVDSGTQWIDQNKWVHKADVINFANAKQAKTPIIEFEWDLELNEWTYTKHNWKYRTDSTRAWESITNEPFICEITPIISYQLVSTNQIVLDSKYGDLTDFFKTGVKFNADGVVPDFEVLYSVYKASTTGDVFKTTIFVDDNTLLGTLPFIHPNKTSNGDNWTGYGQYSQWLYIGADEPIPVNHQPENRFSEVVDEVTPYNKNVREYTIVATDLLTLPFTLSFDSFGSYPDHTNVALAGFNDVRVYINGALQQGNYVENVGTYFTTSITFDTSVVFSLYDVIKVVIGPESILDYGREAVYVRVDSNDNTFTAPSIPLSLIRYRKIPQIKTEVNQYPLFDIYNILGNSYNQANNIFGYKTDDTYAVDPYINQRIIKDTSTQNFTFEQHLLGENSSLLAYRDYARRNTSYWYNSLTQELFVWDGLCWSQYIYFNNYCMKAIISDTQPIAPWSTITGFLWFDTKTNTLKQCSYVFPNTTWNVIDSCEVHNTDPTLQTIWKGNVNRPYVPKKVDWKGRSLEQYDNERIIYIRSRITELFIKDPSKTIEQLTETASEDWYTSQSNPHSVSGVWVGDWEIPAPLYFNNQHENRKDLTFKELFTHFKSIIDTQPTIPGFSGVNSSMFRLFSSNEVDYGLGGTIKEFNGGFDNFLSSLFIEYPSFEQVIRFAQNQYDSLLNLLNESFRQNFVNVLSQNPGDISIDLLVRDLIISEHENNSFYAQLYNDSTVDTIKNWIMTLPFLRVMNSQEPTYVKDTNINTNLIIHHDGHYDSYTVQNNVLDAIRSQMLRIIDIRDNKLLCRSGASLPPIDTIAFQAVFETPIENKNGAIWYDTTTKTLYRIEFSHVGDTSPITPFNLGSKWFNTSDSTVYVLTEAGWEAPNTSTVLYSLGQDFSTWSVFDLDSIFSTTVLDVERKLMSSTQTSKKNGSLDTENIKAMYPALWMQIEEEFFNQYTVDNNIRAPLLNDAYVSTNPFTWNYKSSVPSIGGCWQDVYQKQYNTPIPHIEPWKLQGYNSRPEWWLEEYKNTDIVNVRRWKPVMWDNILSGLVPVGKQYPNKSTAVTGNYLTEPTFVGAPIMPTYAYVSVNISNQSLTVGSVVYDVDALFPPYIDHTSFVDSNSLLPFFDVSVRSIYDSMVQILSPANNYDYGDQGTTEFIWKKSLNYLYSQLLISYRIDPIYTFSGLFGNTKVVIGDLECCVDTNKPESHTDVKFHGDYDVTQYKTNGLNQWYVNFCRYNGYDINSSHVVSKWKGWTAPLSYQMSTFVETDSIQIGHKYVDFSSLDYTFLTKTVPVVEDFWMHTFDVSVLEFPPTYLRNSSPANWKLEISTSVYKGLPLKYYGVHKYQYYIDTITNLCHIFTYPIVNIIGSNIYISGDVQDVWSRVTALTVFNSVTNNNDYTVLTTEYNSTLKQTVITINEPINDLDITGVIKAANYRQIPWITGDMISLATDDVVPSPLNVDKQYFLIVENDTTFKIANRYDDAINDVPLILIPTNNLNNYIGKRNSSFVAKEQQNNSDTWYTYEIDKTYVSVTSLPKQIYGIQTLIDFITGYDVYLQDQGWRFNVNQEYRDLATNRPITWQFELENYIDFLYYERNSRFTKNQISYEIFYDDLNSIFVFTDHYSQHKTGDAIIFSSVNGPLPNGIEKHLTYYMIRVTNSTFKIASNVRNAKSGIEILGISTVLGQGIVSITTPLKKRELIPHKTINPIRKGVWFKPSKGIISSLVPTVENFGKHFLYTQSGLPVKFNNIVVYRLDKLSSVQVDSTNVGEELAVANITVDYYEHLLQFNSKTVDGAFVYDSFLGLNITKIEMDFERQPEDIQRPSVGGYVIYSAQSGQRQLKRNIEGNIDDLRYAYDHTINRNNMFTEKAQQTLGYIKESTSLDTLYISKKSQFEFWKGMIQHKGSLNSIKAFVNSKRFIDAKVDEYWAIKIADYGSMGEKEYPEMKLFVSDTQGSDTRFHFTPIDGIADVNLIQVTTSNIERWYNQPDQRATLNNNGDRLLFDMVPDNKIEVMITGSDTYIEHNLDSNCISGTIKIDIAPITIVTGPVSVLTVPNYIPGTGMIKVFMSGVPIDDFVETSNTTISRVSMFSGSVVITYTNVSLDASHLIPINNNVVELSSSVQNYITSSTEVVLWSHYVNTKTQDPMSIIDTGSQTKVSSIICWDPLKNKHHGLTISNIDVISDNDPAQFYVTLASSESPQTSSTVYTWTNKQVGMVWYDTSTAGYVPYNDPSINTSLDSRVKNWGVLADWATCDVYEWVESDVEPNKWNDLALNEAGDSTLPEETRKSGTVYKTLFRKDGPNWNVMRTSVKHYNAYVLSLSGYLIDLYDLNDVYDGEKIGIYVNGKFVVDFVLSNLTNIQNILTLYPSLSQADRVTVIRQVPINEDTIVEMVNTGNYRYEYQYSTTTTISNFNTTTVKYYFWVKNKTTRTTKNISSKQISNNLVLCPTPYVIFDEYVRSGSLFFSEKINIRGIQGIVGDNERYVLRFTRDYTLRDSLSVESDTNSQAHEEWKLFRKEQNFNIDRWMWDRITESMIGYKLSNSSIRVPSLERELYDTQFMTDTQYGLGDDQTFVNGQTAITTVVAYLEDSTNDFYPLDIGQFLDNYNFNTAENIIETMDTIYSSFNYVHTNRIYFSVLMDAMTNKRKYSGLMKTSLVALHGVKPFQVGGIFDD